MIVSKTQQHEQPTLYLFLVRALPLRMPRGNRKRRRSPVPEMHRNNRYKESPPDFALLASLYPSFRPYLIFPSSDRPTIDFTDFSATRELTRVLLLHDHGVSWFSSSAFFLFKFPTFCVSNGTDKELLYITELFVWY